MKIEQIDSQTYDVYGSDKEPYMVFDSIHKGWTCTCMHFVMNIKDDGTTKKCKHIVAVQKLR